MCVCVHTCKQVKGVQQKPGERITDYYSLAILSYFFLGVMGPFGEIWLCDVSTGLSQPCSHVTVSSADVSKIQKGRDSLY